MSEAQVTVFKKAVIAQLGFPYCWPTKENRYSGKGLKGCKYPDGRDCSGCVTFALMEAGFPDIRANMNCDRIWREWNQIAVPLPGDFALYGTPSYASHIMVLWDDGRVLGASGAGSNCTSPAIARSLVTKVNPNGACVQFRAHPRYRADLLGYIQNPFRGDT